MVYESISSFSTSRECLAESIRLTNALVDPGLHTRPPLPAPKGALRWVKSAAKVAVAAVMSAWLRSRIQKSRVEE